MRRGIQSRLVRANSECKRHLKYQRLAFLREVKTPSCTMPCGKSHFVAVMVMEMEKCGTHENQCNEYSRKIDNVMSDNQHGILLQRKAVSRYDQNI